jgi:hypothetical protein
MFKVGDKVTCKTAVPAYYSDYGGNPKMMFIPGTVGTVVCIAPKVRIIRHGPQHDSKEEMLVVDYDCPVTGKLQRTSLNLCNAMACESPARVSPGRCES